MPEFYMIFARKIFFRNFLGGQLPPHLLRLCYYLLFAAFGSKILYEYIMS